MSEVKCIDAGKFQNHQVYCRGLVWDPLDGGSVVLHGAWCVHMCYKDCHKEGGLVENKDGELEDGFCENYLEVCGQN